MKNVILLLIVCFVSLNSFCQKRDTTTYKNSLAINMGSLILRDLKLTWTHEITKKYYFETMLSCNLPYGKENQTFDNYMLGLYDPFFYYGRVQIRVGLKTNFIKRQPIRRVYMEPMLACSYGHFDKRDASYTDGGEHEMVTRDKIDIEMLYKIGWTFHKHHFLQDLYLGVGARGKFLSDIVYANYYEDTESYSPHPDNPYHSNGFYIVPTVHFGYQIGYCR